MTDEPNPATPTPAAPTPADPLDTLRRLGAQPAARGATSVLLVPDEPPAFRVAGRMVRADAPPRTALEIARLAASVIGTRRLEDLGSRSAAESATLRIDGALSAAVTVARSAGEPTLAAWPIRAAAFDLAALRVPQEFAALADAPSGLLVVTGPSGCGKTTTCFAFVEHVNRTRAAHVVALAYSLECILEGKRSLLQVRQVGADAPDMVAAIGSALAQDADVLFVGEIRDVETLDACLASADSGRLVVTQLHQPTPEAAVRRMIELHPEEMRAGVRQTLARVLRGVLTQRLLRRADGPGRVPAYGFLVPDEAARRAIATGDLDALAALGPPVRGSLEDDVRSLETSGRASAQ